MARPDIFMKRFIPILIGWLALIGCHRTTENGSAGNAPGVANMPPARDSEPRDLGDIPLGLKAAPEDGEAPGPKNSLAFKFRRIFVPPNRQGREAEFLITNRFAKGIKEIQSTLEYLDEAGQLIGMCGWGVSFIEKIAWCEPGETIIDILGSDIPDNATEARVIVRYIKFRDGSESYPLREKAEAQEREAPSPKNSLAIRFERMVVYSKSGRMAEFLITNHFDKDIFEMDATVKYLDHTGQQVGTCPFSFSYQGNTGWCKAGDTIIDKAGYNVPENATNARVVVHRLKFRDGSEWKP